MAPLITRLDRLTPLGERTTRAVLGRHELDLLVTGVGMVAASAWCARTLATAQYECAVNVGVCGAFDRALVPGTVVHVTSDRIVELGAEDGDSFLTIEDLGLVGADDRIALVNALPPPSAPLAELPAVSGITVNTVHGNERSIAAAVERFHPQVESMEGAGFMFACLVSHVPFAQIRAVSNVVERRNRAAWRLADAIDNVGAAVFRVLESL